MSEHFRASEAIYIYIYMSKVTVYIKKLMSHKYIYKLLRLHKIIHCFISPTACKFKSCAHHNLLS